MKKTLLLFMITTSVFSSEMTCEEYEKTISLEESWISCFTDTEKTVADIYISPEINGKRYASNFSAPRQVSDEAQVSLNSKVNVNDISDKKLRLSFDFKNYLNEVNLATLSVTKLANTSRFDSNTFRGRLKVKGVSKDRLICSLTPPAYFEAPSLGCENVDLQSPTVSGDLKRSCLRDYAINSLYPDVASRKRVRFKQDPVTHEVKCIVELK